MKILADENIDRLIVERLRQEGFDIEWIAEIDPSVTDSEVLAKARSNHAVVLTEDKDFGELVDQQKMPHTGVVLIRLEGLLSHSKAEIVSRVIEENRTSLPSAFTVVTPDLVRIRHAKSN